MAFSPALALYQFATRRFTTFAERKLAARLEAGKEDAARIDERRGIASAPRPKGTLVWFHAASVADALALLELIEVLIDERPDLNVLITTGTTSSADVLDARLPDQTIHQYVPLDMHGYVSRFLDHWQPDLAVWTESGLWPNLIVLPHARGVPMISLNTRMSAESYAKWRWMRGAAKCLLARFDLFMAQDATTARHLTKLGAKPAHVQINGSIKESGGGLPHDETARAAVTAALETRPVWLAASTHPGEDEMGPTPFARSTSRTRWARWGCGTASRR